MSNAVLELIIKLKDEATGGLAALRENIGGVALAAGGAVVGGMIAAGGAAVNFAGEAAQAQRDLQASLGLTGDDAAALGDVASDVFGQNWYGSISEATAAVGNIRSQLGDLGETMTGQVAAGVAAIGDSFGTEAPAVVNAVKAIRDNFPGTTEAAALDYIAKGFQGGLNSSGDFLESIGEYSNQFGAGGASADQFFSLMQSGLGAGVLGTDKIGDAFKEFNVRILDGSKTTSGALSTLGLDNLLTDLNTGKVTAADAMGLIVEKLGTVDEATRRQTGVALLGTQFEDLGFNVDAFAGIAGTAFGNAGGAVDSLNVKYGSFGSIAQGAWRQFLVAAQPAADKLLQIANEAMPAVQSGIGWLGTVLPPLIDTAVLAIDGLVAGTQALLVQLQPVSAFITANLTPILAGLGTAILLGVVPGFYAWATAAYTAAAANVAALAPVIIPIVAIGAAVALLVAAWQNDFGGIRTMIEAWWSGTLQPIFAQLQTWLQTTLTAALQALAGYWTNTLQPAILAVWAFIQEQLLPTLGALVTNGFALVQAGLTTLAGFWTGTLKPALDAVWGFISGSLIPLLAALVDVGLAVVEVAVKSLAAVWDTQLKPVLETVAGFVSGVLLAAWTSMSDYFTGTVTPAVEAVGAMITTNVVPAVNSLGDKINAFLKPAMEWLGNFLGGLGSGFDGFVDSIRSAVNWLGKVADSIRSLPGIPGLPTGGGAASGAAAGAGKIPAYAVGTRFAEGGPSLVGERGPELVTLPRGSRVDTARDTAAMFGGNGQAIEALAQEMNALRRDMAGAGGITINTGPISSDIDIERLAYRILKVIQSKQ